LFYLNYFSHSTLPQDPFEIQVNAGCELYSRESPKDFFQVAYEGSDFMSFQNTSWVPSPEAGSRAQKVCDLLNQYEGIKETVQSLVRKTCPQFLLGLLDAGKMYLQRKGQCSSSLLRFSI
jgi:CD1 antigen